METSSNLKRGRDSGDGSPLKRKRKKKLSKDIQSQPQSQSQSQHQTQPQTLTPAKQPSSPSKKHFFPTKRKKNKYHPQQNKVHPHQINHPSLISPLHYLPFPPSHFLGYSPGPILRPEVQNHPRRRKFDPERNSLYRRTDKASLN